MAKIFFNDEIVKTEKEVTILNWFAQEDGVAIFIRDTRPDTYVGRGFIYGDLSTYKMDGNYYIDIDEAKVLDGQVMGMYIAEGSDFEIVTLNGVEPLFMVKQKATALSLGMTAGAMNKGILCDEVTMGMFFEGTTISFNRDGVPIKDKLTKKGWERQSGPKDIDMGILTTAGAYEKKLSREKKEEHEGEDKDRERLKNLKEAMTGGLVSEKLAQPAIDALEDHDPLSIHIFLLDDVKKLKKLGL